MKSIFLDIKLALPKKELKKFGFRTLIKYI